MNYSFVFFHTTINNQDINVIIEYLTEIFSLIFTF
ncbi:hypothetical protein [Campylobacter phage CJLB-12]|nr:hypothetical protein [Campylobacter phage CJLB-12]